MLSGLLKIFPRKRLPNLYIITIIISQNTLQSCNIYILDYNVLLGGGANSVPKIYSTVRKRFTIRRRRIFAHLVPKAACHSKAILVVHEMMLKMIFLLST